MTVYWVALLVTVVATGGVALAAWHLRLAVRTGSWPAVRGYILRSTYAHDNYPAQIDSYRVGIVYEYAVNGVRYTSEQIAIGRSHFLPHHLAKSIVHRYPPGTEVKVYYDPSAPSNAVLSPGQFGHALFNFVAVLIVALIAVSAVWQALWRE